MYLLESPQRGDSNKYTKRMIYKKKLFKSIRYSCFRRVHIKFLYNSKFHLTARSLVTNSVVIARVLCITIVSRIIESMLIALKIDFFLSRNRRTCLMRPRKCYCYEMSQKKERKKERKKEKGSLGFRSLICSSTFIGRRRRRDIAYKS